MLVKSVNWSQKGFLFHLRISLRFSV